MKIKLKHPYSKSYECQKLAEKFAIDKRKLKDEYKALLETSKDKKAFEANRDKMMENSAEFELARMEVEGKYSRAEIGETEFTQEIKRIKLVKEKNVLGMTSKTHKELDKEWLGKVRQLAIRFQMNMDEVVQNHYSKIKELELELENVKKSEYHPSSKYLISSEIKDKIDRENIIFKKGRKAVEGEKMTPHISAKKDAIGKIVLMPGDPLRAKFIADNYLQDAELVNSVRNMFMYTGTYNGIKVTVAGSGMGQPSIGIYSYELFKFYDVDTIIRIGSAGAYKKELGLYDIVIAESAYSDSKAFNQIAAGIDSHVTMPSEEVNSKLEVTANKLGVKVTKGRVHSSDVFYAIRPLEETIKVTEAVCVEMESGALFANAKITGKKAACILTISDNLITKAETSSEERQTAFKEMMHIALESITL